jgi:hypothetical protein
MCELLPNKRIGIVIPFYYLLFSGTVIHFPNGMAIPQTKRCLSFASVESKPATKAGQSKPSVAHVARNLKGKALMGSWSEFSLKAILKLLKWSNKTGARP